MRVFTIVLRVLPLCTCAVACSEQVGSFLRGHESDEVVDISADVVSRINGSAIGIAEVERLAHVGDMQPDAALQRLQAERLLGQEARDRGYADRSRTREVAREAEVQAFLANVVEPVDISTEELEAAYAAHKDRFSQPEKRRGTHVLAQLAPNAGPDAIKAAEAFIVQTIRALRDDDSNDSAAALEQVRAQSSSLFKVVVQELPLAAREGSYVPEFSSALFSIKAPGIVPEPVHTEFGYHAILVSEIVPALEEPRSVAYETLRGELATSKRTQRLQELLHDLRASTRVSFSADAQKILAALDL
jgi:parvulin-like peptidyl-prolyl isomerase